MITVRGKLSGLPGFFLFVFRRWREDRCPQIAGSLTYITLLALVPMFAIAVAVMSSAPIFDDLMTQFKSFLLANLVPEIANRIITVYMARFAVYAERLTWAGTAVVFVVAVAQLLIIDRSLNAIWRVHRSRPYWRTILGYVLLLITAPLLIGASVTITTYLTSLSIGMPGIPPEWHSRALRIVPVSMSALAFFLVYMIIPHRRVPWRHALVGGATAAILFETAKELFAVYVRYAPTYSLVYGTFAAVPVFLIWIYLSWLIVLLGAELTASLGYWRGGAWKQQRTPGSRFKAAIAIARALIDASPAAVSLHRLRKISELPLHEIEDTLQQMHDADIVRHEGRSGYVLAKKAEDIRFEDLHRATVDPIGGLKPQEWAAVSPALERAAAEMQRALGGSLATLREPSAAAPLRKAKRGRARSARSSR
ncbi:MAG: YihY family inner membrane protein [Usitatibacter sp.]